MNTISKYWITHNSLIFTTEPFAEINDLVSYRSFKFALFYDWTLNNNLKASIFITFIDQFYYRLVSVLYNILDEGGYFDKDDYD